MTGLRRFLPRYTLRTLAIFLLLATCVEALWLHREPWYVEHLLDLEQVLGAPVDQQDMIDEIEFGQDGRTVSFRSYDMLSSCSLETGELSKAVKVNGNRPLDENRACGLKLELPDEEHGEMAVLRLVSTGKVTAKLVGHRGLVLNGRISPDGSCVITGAWDGTARLWSTKTGECLRIFDIGALLPGPFDCRVHVELGPDGRIMATHATRANMMSFALWNLNEGTLLFSLSGVVSAFAFSPNGNTLLVGYEGGQSSIIDIGTGKKTIELRGHKASVELCAFSSDSSRAATVTVFPRTYLWDARTGKLLASFPGRSLIPVFSPDGKRLVILTSLRNAVIYRRRRPEWWWGVFYLKEFWATVFFAGFFAWSVWRDRKYFRILDERLALKLAAKAAAKAQAVAHSDGGE